MALTRVSRWLALVGLIIIASLAVKAVAATPRVDVLTVKGAINPVLVDYISRGIEQAEDDGAVACIIQMDTPGGLDTAMRDIIQDMVNARVPVVVYVAPSGSRAASAGAFITIAAHVAAMAPNTTIGAASPVSIGAEGEAQMSETMEAKVLNDAIAYIRSLAESHGRNAEWAEEAVRYAASATDQEALELNVIDMVAPNLVTLVAQLDGWEVTMLDGRQLTISTQGAEINHVNMRLIEDFLYTISEPNIAYLLLSLAMLGILVEVSNPGLIFPGIVGGISLLFAFYSLGMLPVNYAGVLLIVLAFGLFIAEVFTASFGLFTAGGVASLALGSLILFKGGPVFSIDPWLIATVVIIFGGLFAFIVRAVVKTHRRQATTGREELIGQTALAKTALKPEGTVLLHGELWKATLETGRAKPGEEVTVIKVVGLKLQVIKKT
ncbi:nodulation protein NfeD [Chloroflexota bacterium]